MDLTQLHQFITVAECQNVSQAAHKLYITQPALSRSISRLESELEVRLFDRKSNSLILNESGKIFLQHVSAGLDAINAGVHAVRQKNNNRRVLVSNYIFLDDFASFCDRCLSAFPDVDLTCFDGTRTVSDYPTDTAPDLHQPLPEHRHHPGDSLPLPEAPSTGYPHPCHGPVGCKAGASGVPEPSPQLSRQRRRL